MAKRGLCIFLAVVTLLALSVPAFAAETSGKCGDNVTWSLSGGTLTISGTGKMEDFRCGSNMYGDRPPWYSEDDLHQSAIKKVVIQPGVTSIGKGAFWGCSEMTSVTIPDTVTTIGEQAFWTCAALKSVKIPNSVTSIEFGAFLSCGLTSLTIPDSLTTIGDSVFDGCDMTSLTIPDSVTSIGNYAFQHCSSLKSVTIPDSVKSIGAAAFQYDWSLESVTIPSSVTSIGEQAFVGCTSLKSVTIKNPTCKLDKFCIYSDTTVIYGYDGSTAETFAKENDYTFQSLGKAPSASKPAQLAAPTVKISKVSNGIQATWNAVSGSPFYMVYYRENGGSWHMIGSTYKTSYTHPASKLKNGVTYQFTVRCCGNDRKTLLGSYTPSNSLTYVSQLAAPTAKISKVSNGIQVSWNAVSGSPRYMVYYKENGGSWKKIGTTDKTSYTHAASKLKNGVTYQFTVRCCASDRKTLLSGYTASNSLTYSSQLTAPTVKISKVSNGIQATWSAVSGSPFYMVYYRENGGSWHAVGTTYKTSYTHPASKLKSGVTYQFTVRCCGNDRKTLLGSYTPSNSLTYISQLAAPTVKIVKVSNGIQATWNAVSGSPLYMVYYREDGGSWHAIGSTYKTSYTHPASKLKSGATYQFTVRCCGNDRKTLLSGYAASNSLKYTK